MVGSFQGSGDALVEDMPHAAEQPVESANGAAETRRHVLEGKIFVIAEIHRVPMILRQFAETVVQGALPPFQSVAALFRFVSDGAEKIFTEIEPVALAPFAMREHLVKGDLARPGSEISARFETGEVPPHDHFSLLKDVVGILCVGHHGHHVRPEQSFVAGEQKDEFFGAIGR